MTDTNALGFVKMQKLGASITQLVTKEAVRSCGMGLPGVKGIRRVLDEWKVRVTDTMVTYESRMMGAEESIYIKIGPMYFALIQNWSKCPDGLNRTLFAVPLYGERDGIHYIFGVVDIPIEICADAQEAFVNILVDLHNA